MGARLQGGQVTLSAAPQTLTALLRAVDPAVVDQPYAPLTIRADSVNSGQVRILKGPADTAANRCAYLVAGESTSLDIRSAGIHTDGIWLVSSVAGEKAWILGVEI